MFRPALFLAALLFATPAACLAANDEPAKPIDRPAPAYPDSAGEEHGHVKVQFTIDPEGHVRDPQILESVPPGLFDRAVLETLKSWRYQPRRVLDRPTAQPDNSIAFNFAPPPPDPAHTAVILTKAIGFYPREAFKAGQEGDVTVAFDVDRFGYARHATVLNSTLPGIFDQSAIEAIRNSRFQPPIINGEPVEATGFISTVPFRLATAKIAPIVIERKSLPYPREAQRKGIQGYCYVVSTIAGDGTVSKAEVIDTNPSDYFKKACLDYALAERFEAPDQDPTGRLEREHLAIIDFQFNGSQTLLQPGQWVRIRYNLGIEGQALQPEIIGVSDPAIDSAAVLRAFKGRRIKPATENGLPVEKPDQIIVISGD
jgi:TonB family protein